MRVNPDNVINVACIGAGTIGAGWAAFFLSRGLQVQVWDPSPAAEANVRLLVDNAWPALEALGLAPGADRARLTVHANLADAVENAQFVQESAPDFKELKIKLTKDICANAPFDTVVASSSSLFLPSELRQGSDNPNRCIIGHPFTPSYLIPLVETVGAPDTPPEIMEWANRFYSHLGKSVVMLKNEYEAYIGNRLQSALIDEARRLIDAGICDYGDIDTVVTESIGLRWAFMGPSISAHLAGGRGGIKAAHAHFGWSGSERSRRSLLNNIEKAAGSMTIAELEVWRDKNIIDILKSRRLLAR